MLNKIGQIIKSGIEDAIENDLNKLDTLPIYEGEESCFIEKVYEI